jgi:transcription antitermination factor NusG
MHVLEASPNSKPAWYALQVRSRRENHVVSQISSQGYECFLPTYRNVRQWSDRVKEVEQPLFPGYLFCRFNFHERRPVTTTPGVMQIVGTGRTAVPVDDNEIIALQLALSSGLPRQPWPYLEVGQRVRINYGNLRGLEGLLVNLKGNHRVVLSVSLLQRSVAMEVDAQWLTAARETSEKTVNKEILRPVPVAIVG